MKQVSFRQDILPLKNQLYRLALRITLNSAEAEDVVQETLIRVWNKRGKWSEIESMEAFCFTICRNLALDSTRQKGNDNGSLDDLPMEHAHGGSDPLRATQLKDDVDIVRKIVDSLPEKQRSCMQLRDFEGKPYKEIAAILGISEEQVKVNIFRARQAVRERFAKINEYGL